MNEINFINISDVRTLRQLSKQVNETNFAGHVKGIQRTRLSELLGGALYTDFMVWATSGWINSPETFTKTSSLTILAEGVDLSALVGQDIRINNDCFFQVTDAVYDLTDTLITIEFSERPIPETITALDYKPTSPYITLLNGGGYTDSDNEYIYFYGVRPFLCWQFLASWINDGALKQADAGNVNFTDAVYSFADGAQMKRAKDEFLTNATKEQNVIVDFLNENSTDFPKWNAKNKINVREMDFVII